MANPWAMPWQPKYRGRVAILDDYRERISLGLLKNGVHDLNTTDYRQIGAARKALIAPFWISYMMRMLAWIDLLATGGYVNKALGWLGIDPVNWLGGHSVTVVFGLVYGYIPYRR